MNKWKKGRITAKKPAPGNASATDLNGIVENIVFHSETTGYCVACVKAEGHPDPVTVVGTTSAIWPGEAIKAEGNWVRHERHGYQFQANSLTCIPPTSARGIERYLASGMIRGIGKVNAERIVKAFGEDALRIIEKESRRLEEVEGIGPKRRQMIKESWNEQKGIRDVMIFLQGHGIGTAQSARIYKHYGGEAIALIRTNPYRLCADIWGIGFKTADSVAVSVGIPRDSEVRARAGLVYVLQTMTEEGHCYCMAPELILRAEQLLEIPVETLGNALNSVVEEGVFIKENHRIYPADLYEAEISVSQSIKRLTNTRAGFSPIDTAKALPWAEKLMKLTFARGQSQAITMALTEKVSIITGGPGVGKTTIIKALVDIFGKRELDICLAAPTGRAAKRMNEATGHEAKTIHRLLRFMPVTGHFEHDRENPLEADVLIFDEASMIDIRLARNFLNAIPDEACVVIVGDVDQLPSIGPGNFLRDLINSGTVPFCRLDTIFRQEHGGMIVQNAHRINTGESIETADPSDNSSDFYFIETGEPDLVVERVKELVLSRIPGRFGFDPMQDIQVLTPMRRNQLGTENINAIMQEALNPKGEEVKRFGRVYRNGDRVMQIQNNYDKEVFNGDIGFIVRVDTTDQVLTVEIDGRPIKYEFTELDELILAYACTIHKSQGCEYPAVVILLATQHFKLLQRNLLYTAITRGKKLVCLVGSSKAVNIAIRNNEILLRRTALSERLSNARGVQSEKESCEYSCDKSG